MMNKRESILPDSINIYPNLTAFDIAMKQWLEGVQLDRLLIYAVDRVDPKVLPLLAYQFDVLGNKGWRLCQTVADKRKLIKRAVELHRFKGTPWAIKQALKSIGFANVVIEEHTSGHWARFKVYLDNNQVTLTSALFADVISMIEEYKNARSVLDGVFITIAVDDEIIDEEEYAAVYEEIRAEDIITINAAHFYDGVDIYDGSIDHSSESDVALIS